MRGREGRLEIAQLASGHSRRIVEVFGSQSNLLVSAASMLVFYICRDSFSGSTLFMAALIWTIVSLFVVVFRDSRLKSRQRDISAQWPAMLQGMSSMTQAGLDLRQAFQMAALRVSGPLRQEIEKVVPRLSSGQSLGKALAVMEKDGVAQAKRLSSMLIQAEILGTPVSMVLQSLAEEAQDGVYQEDEERFNSLPTKLSLVTVVFLLPPVLIISIAPHILTFLRSPW